jgi:hypothetical protein
VLPHATVGRAFREIGVENDTLLADGSAELAEVLPVMAESELRSCPIINTTTAAGAGGTMTLIGPKEILTAVWVP